MRHRIVLALLIVTGTAACSEAPTSPRSNLRAVGASRDATVVDGGGMYGSGHKVDQAGTSTTTGTTALDMSVMPSDSTNGDERGGGTYGSGH